MEVEKTRDKDDGLLRLFPANLTGDSLFGLTEAAVSKMTESVRMESLYVPMNFMEFVKLLFNKILSD